MANAIEKLTDFLLVLGINNMAFLMLLASVLFFLPEPIDAVAAPLRPNIVAVTGPDVVAVTDPDLVADLGMTAVRPTTTISFPY